MRYKHGFLCVLFATLLPFCGCQPAAPSAIPTDGSLSPSPGSASSTKTALPTPAPGTRPTESPSSPQPSPFSTPTQEPTGPAHESPAKLPLNGLIIGVDPGHQIKANKDQEPNAPGSSVMKNKVSSGTSGRFTGVMEHEVNLNVGLLLRDMLKEAGATVVMTRETAEVDLSNVDRAQLFNEEKVDLGVRIHCNGSEDASVNGAFMMVPKSKNQPFYEENRLAAQMILEEYGKATGIGIKKGLQPRADQTGFNWCERPIVAIEMGHMTNEEEDYLLTDPEFQVKMAEGIFNGILRYFSEEA